MNSFNKIYNIVKKIPHGKVASYGQIAKLAGNPNWARIVGYALHKNPDPKNIPCYRVVNKDGKISKSFAFGGMNVQKTLLKNEGINFIDEITVDMKKHQW